MAHHPAVFRAPQLHLGDSESNRRVTWTELFYDLVYVATIVQLGDYLSDNSTLEGFAVFVLLFIPIWWAWVGTTFYANRFDSDDTIHRLLVLVQITGVYNMAISVGQGLGENTARFALAYAFVRFILVIMYWRAGRAIPQARGLTTRYGAGFALAAVFWVISAFVPPPLRYGLWVVGFVIDFGTPLLNVRYQLQLPPSASHLPERFGLFTIIVLGEGFLKVVGGMAGEVMTIPQILLDTPGLIIAAALWWIYFDNVAETRFRINRFKAQIWLYTHLLLHLGLIALSVGIYKLVTASETYAFPDNYRWLICGSTALCLFAIGIIEWSVARSEDEIPVEYIRREFALRMAGAAGALLLAVFGGTLALSATLIMLLLALIGVLQVGVDLYWRYQHGQKETTIEGVKMEEASAETA